MTFFSFQNKLFFISFFSILLFTFVACSGSKTDKQDSNSSISSLGYFYKDTDGDGFGDPNQRQQGTNASAGFVSDNTDCNDQNKRVNSASTIPENINAAIDYNCDGIYGWLPQKIYLDRGTLGGIPVYCTVSFDPLERKKTTLCHRNESPSSEIMSVTEFIYDSRGNTLITRTRAGDLASPVTFSTEYTYDDRDNILTQKTHRNGDVTTPVTSSTETAYHENGKRLFFKEHERGDLTSPVTFSIEHFYDSQGNEIRRKMDSEGGAISVTFPVELVYDSQDNELTYKEYRGRDSTIPTYSREYTYDHLGNKLTEKIHGGGDLTSPVSSSVEFVYDNRGNILFYKEHRHGDLTSPVDFSREYTYDEKGNRLSMKEHNGDLTSPVTASWETQSGDYLPVRHPIKGGIYGR